MENAKKRTVEGYDYEALTAVIERDGFIIIKGVFTPDVIAKYYEECRNEFKTASHLEGKNYIPGKTPNYTQPWSINHDAREVGSYRLYQFYHNPMSENTKHIVETVIEIRDRLESKWPAIQEMNRKMQFVDYNIVAKYEPEAGYQSIHSDLNPSTPHPALQCQIMLTAYGDDYLGGSLVLHLRRGSVVELNKDCDVSVGDLIIFDKRIQHEVRKTLPGNGRNAGRYMALIGAKTFSRSDSRLLRDAKIRLVRMLYLRAPILHNVLKSAMKFAGKDISKAESGSY